MPRPPRETKAPAVKIKVAVIGLGAWGREIVNTLARMPQATPPLDADIAAICDTYPPFVTRTAKAAPGSRADGGLQDDPRQQGD